MDIIQFGLEELMDDMCKPYHAITVNVNGRDLIDRVVEAERPYLIYPEHDPDWARISTYLGLLPKKQPDFREIFMGGYRPPYTVILTCSECPMPGCIRVTANIDVNDEVVSWTDIINPELGGKEMPVWVDGHTGSELWVWHPIDYSRIGPYYFDHDQYVDALDQLTLEWKRVQGAGRC